jgi:hypothetical protein
VPWEEEGDGDAQHERHRRQQGFHSCRNSDFLRARPAASGAAGGAS